MGKAKGFTLVEILVVLVILSIVASVAMISVSHNQNKRVESIAQQLVQSFTLAQEQAMLQPTVVGLKLTSSSFQFDAYRAATQQQKALWQPLKKALLGKQTIPDSIEIFLQQGKETVSLGNVIEKPQVIISITGEVTPFTLLIAEKGHKPRFKIIGEANGRIQLISI